MFRSLARWLFLISGLLVLLCGCVPPLREQLPELADRRPPALQPGSLVTLLDHPPLGADGFFANDGSLHLFTASTDGEVAHWQLGPDGTVVTEKLGQLADADDRTAVNVAAVEHPSGVLRVLADEAEFVKGPAAGWRERMDNRCLNYLPLGERMFCSALISGSEISMSERTDWSGGILLILPIAWWHNVIPTKLALLEEGEKQWLLRVVFDPASELDAVSLHALGADSCGTLHALYTESRGGMFFLVGGGPGGGGAIGGGHPDILRYARLPVAQLLEKSPLGEDSAFPAKDPNPRWVAVESVRYQPPPLGDVSGWLAEIAAKQGYVNASADYFVINNDRCQVNVYSGILVCDMVVDGHKVVCGDDRPFLIYASLKDSVWKPEIEAITASGTPDPALDGSWQRPTRVAVDNLGNSHLLVKHLKVGFWKSTWQTVYFGMGGGGWSAPLVLGLTVFGSGRSDVLTVSKNGDLFAAWIDEDGRFVGRWLTPLFEENR